MSLLLGAIRAERFCDGTLNAFLKTGCIDKWLSRLQEIEGVKNFSLVKTHMGNGKMIEAIINSIEEGRLPFPGEIVKYVESYMNSIE